MARSVARDSSRFAAAGTILTVALFVGGVIALLAGQRALAEYAGQARTTAPTVVFDWPPLGGPARHETGDEPATWLSRTQRDDLERLALGTLTGNPMDQQALARTREALIATGWFTSIDAVRREGRGVVRIVGQWRAPAAVVRANGRDHLVSTKGELLPVSYRPDASRLKVIHGASTPPPQQPGAPWIGGDVQAGLALLAYLQPTGVYDQVAGVDVAAYTAHRRLEIITDRASRIAWGMPPGEFGPAEPTPEVKLKWLLFLRASGDYGRRIDGGRPRIDVTSPRGIMIDDSGMAGAPPEPEAAPPTPPAAPSSDRRTTRRASPR